MKSIMQEDRTYCFLCGRNGYGDPLEEHHAFGGHRNGKNAVHQCGKTADYIHAEAQKAWEAKYGTREEFMARYGKNYL